MPNVLVSTFGGTWAIAAEILAICAYPELDVLANNISLKNFTSKHEEIKQKGFDEIWLICTHGKQTNDALTKFSEWLNHFAHLKLPAIKYIGLEKLEDLTSEEECRQMTDFIYRVVLNAREYTANGQLVLSLAGGRKTMSSDMQRAADLFGCDALIHIANNHFPVKNPDDFYHLLSKEQANEVFIVEVHKNKSYNPIIDIDEPILAKDYPLLLSRENKPSEDLYNLISERLQKAESIHYNAYRYRTGQSNQTIFHGLQQLSPSTLKSLENEQPTREWIKRLPKTDLHCHFGGILDVRGLIKTALSNKEAIKLHIETNCGFYKWYKDVEEYIAKRESKKLQILINEKEKLRNEIFPELPKPIVVSAFISAFENDCEYLENLIFGDYRENENFRNIGIENYEKLGDLQGSALLQSEASIQYACQYLIDYCKEQNIRYLELRCSPCNYTRGGITEEKVIEIMYENLKKQDFCDIRLIIIGSRHGNMDVFKRHVNLALKMLQSEIYRDFIVGFDVAGNEEKAKPSDLRTMLLPLLEECMHLTIHAGETQSVENIWQAVYELNTDRIGHGLTLVNNKELLKRFRDRNIVIELCPSSNFQICDYNSTNKEYPLKKYMQEGLKVTLNTDNPGISRTTITDEYFTMSEYAGLKKLEILQLLRNSFQGVFLPKDEKKRLIVSTENELYKILTSNQV